MVLANRDWVIDKEGPLAAALKQPLLALCARYTYTSVKIIKNEVGCRDDTVPKTVDTRRHCKEE